MQRSRPEDRLFLVQIESRASDVYAVRIAFDSGASRYSRRVALRAANSGTLVPARGLRFCLLLSQVFNGSNVSI